MRRIYFFGIISIAVLSHSLARAGELSNQIRLNKNECGSGSCEVWTAIGQDINRNGATVAFNNDVPNINKPGSLERFEGLDTKAAREFKKGRDQDKRNKMNALLDEIMTSHVPAGY